MLPQTVVYLHAGCVSGLPSVIRLRERRATYEEIWRKISQSHLLIRCQRRIKGRVRSRVSGTCFKPRSNFSTIFRRWDRDAIEIKGWFQGIFRELLIYPSFLPRLSIYFEHAQYLTFWPYNALQTLDHFIHLNADFASNFCFNKIASTGPLHPNPLRTGVLLKFFACIFSCRSSMYQPFGFCTVENIALAIWWFAVQNALAIMSKLPLFSVKKLRDQQEEAERWVGVGVVLALKMYRRNVIKTSVDRDERISDRPLQNRCVQVLWVLGGTEYTWHKICTAPWQGIIDLPGEQIIFFFLSGPSNIWMLTTSLQMVIVHHQVKRCLCLKPWKSKRRQGLIL